MTFKLGLAQVRHPEDGDSRYLVRRVAEQAAARGVELLVFPEYLMTPYEAEASKFAAAAEPLDGPFVSSLRHTAAECGIWMICTCNERNEDVVFAVDVRSDAASCTLGGESRTEGVAGGLPFNTAVLIDDRGELREVYRKAHMFDVGRVRESDRMSAGDSLLDPVDTPFGRLGVAICYDLRFPEVARYAAMQGCQLMVYTAAWVDGPFKAHQWQTLLAARAIENGMFVAGVCRADSGYAGHSCIVDPRGCMLASAGVDEELLIADIDTSQVNESRAAVPVLDHRRPELYGTE